MPRIISLNFNGIRSAARKGCFEWLARQKADVLCVQEIKAQAEDMVPAFLTPRTSASHMHGHFHYAEKKGYSGAGVYSRVAPSKVRSETGMQRNSSRMPSSVRLPQFLTRPMSFIVTIGRSLMPASRTRRHLRSSIRELTLGAILFAVGMRGGARRWVQIV